MDKWLSGDFAILVSLEMSFPPCVQIGLTKLSPLGLKAEQKSTREAEIPLLCFTLWL